ncbi:MAG TPA: betaine/proline/choline family ABC transporter ATP-binding protein [Hypericibacter adhaerens]|jgi:glycine betaine/proline transport system ATP-binding protein|uniref:Quaternary amine transport ATP-binding protein n=1 Tax=Hypericibacter adhaerens TaxID=2602016 RepID=A0A5J6MVH8_9PROT|nr:betaine/proline/choline family ABC transporter ATP-binding protein [Hypericibacter adhaerens]QEX21652.1 ABC transporter ATP-binding protein [Hypericibacter adhaerens]HWA44477.1 betaine/proline/choline family ABC transporter ATP-binding protein [Hypericibacter adhaerens]
MAREVKLSCRNLWKVYGANADSFFPDREGKVADAAQQARQIRDSGHVVAVGDASFDVHQGEIFIIMGLSGSGKSTIVRCLSRLVEPTAGHVFFNGADLLKASREALTDIRRHKMGMVFQNFGLMPHLNVIDNVAFPLKVQGMAPQARLQRAAEMLELVGLKGRERSYPSQLSGGQQQRVGIARSLAVEPELWFLDEPFSALDPLIRRQMQDEFLRLQKLLHKTIVFITHDFLEALRLGDRIAIMKDGAVVQIGTPSEVVTRPADAYVAEFTRDVPRVKVITAQDVMTPVASEVEIGGTVPMHLSLEMVIPRFESAVEALACTDESGEVRGHITAQGVLAALAAEAAVAEGTAAR